MLEGIKLEINDMLMIESEGSELLVIQGYLNLKTLFVRWRQLANAKNCGAVANFTGFVRQEKGMQKDDGLYFEIYEPLLVRWFTKWKEKLEEQHSFVCMAHSLGFVPLSKSSFSVSIVSPKRRVALMEIDAFVEDFKNNAPIWKYDYIGGERFFVREYSKAIEGSGLFGEL